jgi:hypothetical protein
MTDIEPWRYHRAVDFVNDRKRRVDLKFITTHCYCSGWETVKCGFPQGSVLGLWYINDFPKVINKLSHMLLFAGDTSIHVKYANCIELNQKLNSI